MAFTGVAIERGPLADAAGRNFSENQPTFVSASGNILPHQREILATPPAVVSATLALILPPVGPSIGRHHSVFVNGAPAAGAKVTVTAAEGSGVYQVADLDTDGDGVVVESDGRTWREIHNVS